MSGRFLDYSSLLYFRVLTYVRYLGLLKNNNFVETLVYILLRLASCGNKIQYLKILCLRISWEPNLYKNFCRKIRRSARSKAVFATQSCVNMDVMLLVVFELFCPYDPGCIRYINEHRLLLCEVTFVC